MYHSQAAYSNFYVATNNSSAGENNESTTNFNIPVTAGASADYAQNNSYYQYQAAVEQPHHHYNNHSEASRKSYVLPPSSSSYSTISQHGFFQPSQNSVQFCQEFESRDVFEARSNKASEGFSQSILQMFNVGAEN